jgi:hypothetical protein
LGAFLIHRSSVCVVQTVLELKTFMPRYCRPPLSVSTSDIHQRPEEPGGSVCTRSWVRAWWVGLGSVCWRRWRRRWRDTAETPLTTRNNNPNSWGWLTSGVPGMRVASCGRAVCRYEDYLDKQITSTDVYYLEDIELARQLVELGYVSVGRRAYASSCCTRHCTVRVHREPCAGVLYPPSPRGSELMFWLRRSHHAWQVPWDGRHFEARRVRGAQGGGRGGAAAKAPQQAQEARLRREGPHRLPAATGVCVIHRYTSFALGLPPSHPAPSPDSFPNPESFFTSL